MKEVICIHIGQAGVQMGNAIWELLTAEHGMNALGEIKDATVDVECIETFFSLSHANRHVPRSIFVDLECSVIDEVRRGSYRDLFHPNRLIAGPEDAASNFARGFFTVGKLLLGVVNNEIKKLLESGDNTQAIFIFRSLGGGTGSGLTSAMFDCLAEYGKLVKIEMPIYPSPTLSTAMVEPYNCLLSEHFCMEDIDVGLLLDNEALYDMCSKYLSLNLPTYTTINRIISQLTSSITASIRFENVLNCDISVLQTNLVPYPRIHFPLANFAPVLCASKAVHEEITVADLTKAVFEKDNQLMKIDHSFGRFMSCSLFYRGEVSPYHVYMALTGIKKEKHIEFVEWCPTGFKVGINIKPPTSIPASQIYPTSKNLTMLANTSSVGQSWQRLTHKFYMLYSKRSFVHWFVGEGMEECEFTESLYNISALVKDYEEVSGDRVEEDISAANPDTSPEQPIEENADQTNTAFAEAVKEPDIIVPENEVEEVEIQDNLKNEENYAIENDVNERADDVTGDVVDDVPKEAGEDVVEGSVDKEEEDSIPEEPSKDDEEADDENNQNYNFNDKEESSPNEQSSYEKTEEDNQNYNFNENQSSSNLDLTFENDNTLDNVQVSTVEEDLIKEVRSSML